MTPTKFQVLIARTGRSKRALAKMLGYGSENTMRRLEAGTQGFTLSEEQIKWLQAYADMREKARETEAKWLLKHPIPTRKQGA